MNRPRQQTLKQIHPYYYICNKINILIVDDYMESFKPYYTFLSEYYLYHVDYSDSFFVAQSKLEKGQYHVCIVNIDLLDSMNDEYYLVKKFSSKMPLIVTGCLSTEQRSLAFKYGAIGVLSKPFHSDYRELVYTINEAFVYLLSHPLGFHNRNPFLKKCCEILWEMKPNTIFDWSVKSGISESNFRTLWCKSFTLKPDYFLFLFHLFIDAIQYCDDAFKNIETSRTYSSEYRLDRQRSYFRVHASVLNSILSRLSAANCTVKDTLFQTVTLNP